MRHEISTLLEVCDDLIEAIGRDKRSRLEKRLEREIAKAFSVQGRLFAAGIRKLSSRLSEAEGDGGGWELVWDKVSQQTLKLFSGPIDRATIEGLKAGALSVIGKISAGIGFDLKSPRVVEFLKGRAAERVTGINDHTKDQMRSLISDLRAEGKAWNEIARAIQDKFDGFSGSKPQAHVDSRAHLVAMTEVGDAYSEGTLQGAAQIEAAGIQMAKFWQDSGDNRVSDGCRANQAAGWILLDQDFPSGHQRPLRFPGCRCVLLTRRAGGVILGGPKASRFEIKKFVDRNDLQAGERIDLARIPANVQKALGSKTNVLHLSGSSVNEHRKHSLDHLYEQVNDLMAKAEHVVMLPEDPKRGTQRVAFYSGGQDPIVVAIKRTKEKDELYLASVHRYSPNNMKNAMTKGTVLK